MGGVLALAALVVVWSSEVEAQDQSKLMIRNSTLTVLATSRIVELHVVMLWADYSPWQSYMWYHCLEVPDAILCTCIFTLAFQF